MTVVLGLTGSLGMGKSTIADLFRRRGVPVFDADATVHALYRGAAAPLIEAAFPGTVVDGIVDRSILTLSIAADGSHMGTIERIVHPLVRQAQDAFLARWRAAGAALVVLDIPLLFETGNAENCHAVVVVSAPTRIQRERVLARPGMNPARLDAILARQMPDADKRRRAHVVIDTARGLDDAQMQVDDLIRALAGLGGHGLAGAQL
jgi:dephospho-CoA kinase